MIVEFAFWACVVLVAYVYVGYPLLLALFVQLSGRVERDERRDFLPRVTLLVSAYNEADCIAEKLANTLALDYPRDLLEVLVISDASDDDTDQIVQRYASRGVRLLRMAERGGKTLGLNAAVSQASGDVIVFSDANAMYVSDAIRWLVAPLADATIGAVIGESSYVQALSASAQSESLYWRYETWIKGLESRHGSVVGGDGAIYSVRRILYQPMRADALSDFVNPLQVVRAGFRCVYEPRALSYEEAAPEFGREYRRKVRIVNRAWRALWSMRDMLNPVKHETFALKLWSHKVLRWWAGFAALLILISNIALFGEGGIYSFTLYLQLAFYSLAVSGLLFQDRKHQPFLFRVPYYFCLVNVAAGVGLLEALRGRSYATWSTSRVGG